eukprot:12601454-Alexandrium_andersonii.AAC.1
MLPPRLDHAMTCIIIWHFKVILWEAAGNLAGAALMAAMLVCKGPTNAEPSQGRWTGEGRVGTRGGRRKRREGSDASKASDA